MALKNPMQLKIPRLKRDITFVRFQTLFEMVQEHHNYLIRRLPEELPDTEKHPPIEYMTETDYGEIIPEDGKVYLTK